MDDITPPPSHRAASAAHPGRSPPSPPRSPRLTGAPSSTVRRACVSSPKSTATPSGSHKTRNSPAGLSRSPLPAAAPTRSTWPVRPPRATPRPARSCTATTHETNPANASSSAAATAGPLSVPHVPASTPETRSTSSAPGSWAARTSRTACANTLGSSSHSPLRPSARFIAHPPPGNAVGHDAVRSNALTKARPAAPPSTIPPTLWSANRSVPTATTTWHMSSGTRTPGSSGTVSLVPSVDASLLRPACRKAAFPITPGCPSPRSPSIRSARQFTSMLSSGSTVRPVRQTHRRPGAQPLGSAPPYKLLPVLSSCGRPTARPLASTGCAGAERSTFDRSALVPKTTV